MLRYIFMIPGAEAAAVLGLPELAIFWCDTGLAVSFFSFEACMIKRQGPRRERGWGLAAPPPHFLKNKLN